MKKKLNWRLAGVATCIILVIILVIGGGVFLFVRERAVIRQLEREAAEAEKLLEESVKLQMEQARVTTDKSKRPPPPGETHETGYWHEDHWHRTVPIDPKPTPNTKKGKELSQYLIPAPELIGQLRAPEEIKAYRQKWGVDPPPIGADWQHIRNHNGEVIRHYNNTVTILYREGIGFAPNLEQWEQHEALQAEITEAERRGDTAEYDRILAELTKLVAESQGPVPIIDGGLYSGNPISNEEEHRKILEAEREVYRKFGLVHTLQ